ncbi:MAG: Y4bD/Y4pK family protein [Thermoleophilia bacterium]|nr:Y4bD/Y4pK family protein [Thermoleophilia bacterium]
MDPFLAISAGRAHFRVEDLVALVSLVQELKSREV